MLFEKGSTQKARQLAENWLSANLLSAINSISLGLPEYDDRFKKWRVPLHLNNGNHFLLGEVYIDEQITEIIDATNIKFIKKRIEKYRNVSPDKKSLKNNLFYPAAIPNKVILGNCIDVLEEFPPNTAQLIFTSPPYFNAKPEYSEYVDYQEYLDFMRKMIVRVHSILSEGRFFVINVSPVLIRRTSRATSSKRLPIPFDLH
jgi:hypothetical protein